MSEVPTVERFGTDYIVVSGTDTEVAYKTHGRVDVGCDASVRLIRRLLRERRISTVVVRETTDGVTEPIGDDEDTEVFHGDDDVNDVWVERATKQASVERYTRLVER